MTDAERAVDEVMGRRWDHAVSDYTNETGERLYQTPIFPIPEPRRDFDRTSFTVNPDLTGGGLWARLPRERPIERRPVREMAITVGIYLGAVFAGGFMVFGIVVLMLEIAEGLW